MLQVQILRCVSILASSGQGKEPPAIADSYYEVRQLCFVISGLQQQVRFVLTIPFSVFKKYLVHTLVEFVHYQGHLICQHGAKQAKFNFQPEIPVMWCILMSTFDHMIKVYPNRDISLQESYNYECIRFSLCWYIEEKITSTN